MPSGSSLVGDHVNALSAGVWQKLIESGTSITGSPTRLDPDGIARYPEISFSNIESLPELNQSVGLAASLPGVRNLSLAAKSTQAIGVGTATDETIEILAAGFVSLDSLNLNGTQVTNLRVLGTISMRELKIVNVPINPDSLSSLRTLHSVTDLWIGWNDNGRHDEAIYFSDFYKKKLLDSLTSMRSLTNLHYRQLRFTRDEVAKLGGIRLIRDG